MIKHIFGLLSNLERPAEELSAERLKKDKRGYELSDSVRIFQSFLSDKTG